MSEDALTLPIQFPDADRTQLQLEEVLKSLGALERKILETGGASEANAKKILALTTSFTQGKSSADELRAQLVALAGDLPKTADALKRDAADAAKKFAEEAKRAADAAEALAKKQELIDQRARTMGSSLEGSTSRMSRFGEMGVNVGRGLGVAAAGAAALAAGGVHLLRTIGELNGAAELHADSLRGLGGAYAGIERATAGTLNATEAYRMRMTLFSAQVRVTDRDLATIARHARDHGDITKSVAERVQELTEALRGGEAEGLRKYGISVSTTASRTHNLRSALEQMTRAAGNTAPAARTAGEELERFNRSMDMGAQALGALADHALGARGAMASLGESIRSAANDIQELIERENQLPQNRAQAQARTLATDAYTRAQRGLGQNLRNLGFSQEEITRLVPSTALGRLTPEQVTARTAELQRVQGLIAAQNMQRSGNGISLRPTGPAAVIFDPGDNPTARSIWNSGGGTLPRDLWSAGNAPARMERQRAPGMGEMPTVSLAENRAALAGLRAVRHGADPVREQARIMLEGLARSMATDATANEADRDRRLASQQQQQRASAPNAPGSPRTVQRETVWSRAMDTAFGQIEQTLGDRRVPTFGRGRAAQMDAEDSLRQRELTESPQAMARLAQLRDRETRDREARLDDQRLSVQQAEQLVSLRRDEARFRRPIEVARQTALLNAQADVEHQRRMVSLAADIARASSERGAANQVAEERLSGRSSRARARNSREAERQDLRDPAVERERLADAREERSLGKERDRLQYRIDAQVSFTDRMEELAGRRRSAAQMEAEGVTSAFGAMGEAFSSHLQAVIAGREDLGTALQGMLSDTLMAISKESAIKAGLYLAEGFASLVFYQYDRAAEAFAASALFTGVAVASGLGGAALAPAAPATSAASGAADRGRQLDTGRKPSNDNGRGGATIIEMHYYSPVIGGRDATEAEVGRGMQRYQSAADRRRLGRTGTDG